MQTKDERRRTLDVFILIFLLVLALFVGMSPVAAQEGALVAGAAPAPVAGTDAIVFVSQAVEARLYRADDGSYRADATGAVRLHNTDRFDVATITLGWPGWPGGELRFDPAKLTGFSATKGGQPLPTQVQSRPTSWGGEARESEWLVAQTTIDRDARERILFAWSQPLGQGPLLTYSFGLIPASAWSGPVGSARVTLELPQVASQEIIVAAEPADYTFLGERIEWILVELEPSVNPRVTIIAPHLWSELQAVRD
ncbi:MAG: hypothetical protein ACRDIB_13510, partial [Ardenticatenaceae bacterium]